MTPTPAGPEARPVVLIDGVPEPRLSARELRMTGPIDRRSATLDVVPSSDRGKLIDHWVNSDIALAIPNRLVDETIRWSVLLHGRLNGGEITLSAGADDHAVELVDHWTLSLDKPVRAAWWQTSGGLLFDDARPAVMKIGDDANRSEQTWEIGGQTVHVFQGNGQQWTIITALASLNAMASLALSLKLIPSDIRDQPLTRAVDLGRSIGDTISTILEPFGLVVQRDLARESGVVIEKRTVRDANHGRIISLAWTDNQRPVGQVSRVDTNRPAEGGQQWIARTNGWRVESTFDMVKGWDPSLEGQPDATYDKNNNPNFGTYANVFRLWALNEDGQLSGSPYNQGTPFDLGQFFGVALIRPRALRFLPTLTLDDTGDGRPPIVEISNDAGVNWSVYPGAVVISTGQATVYLNDAALPVSFLAAAKVGNAKVRVTASLQSPAPVQLRRWSGNPFVGIKPAKVFELGDAFRFQRVSPGSIHYNDLVAGQLAADEINQTNALNDWLFGKIKRSAGTVEAQPGRTRLTLVGAWPLLRPGDQIINTGNLDTDAAGRNEAVGGSGAVVRALRCRWPNGIFTGRASVNSSPQTVVEVSF